MKKKTTDIIKSDGTLSEREALYRSILNASPDGIVITDLESRIMMVSTSGLKMLGCDSEEKLSGHFIHELIEPQDRERLSSNIALMFKGSNPGPVEYQGLRVDGSTFHMEINSEFIRNIEGHSTHMIFIIRDITARKIRKKTEEEIKRLNEDLEHRVILRTRQLEAVNKELESFSYSVSHDLRAPVRHIIGFSEIVKNECSGQLSEEGRHYLNTIIGSAQKMGVLIDDLLSFSRTGRAEITKSCIDMNQVVDDALSQVRLSIEERPIDWNVSTMPGVLGDYNLLRQVWINLFDNAVKYTKTRENPVISVGFRDEPDETVFYIYDNGVGFDMRFAHKLFGVFQRLHSISQFDGTGIGLANVRRIISRHGGRTWADAEVDKGATFYFSLPKNESVIISNK